MPYFPFRRLAFGGRIYDATAGGNAVEYWSCSLSVSAVAFTTTLTAELAIAEPIIRTWFTSGNLAVSPTCSLEYVKYNAIGANGKQTTDPTVQVLLPASTRGGGSSSVMLPTFVSMRVSLDNQTRSRRAKGGFYLPRPASNVDVNGRWSSGITDIVADHTEAMLESLNSSLEGSVVIASGVDATNTVVTRLRIGRVPDVIRRRKNDLLESYVSRLLA